MRVLLGNIAYRGSLICANARAKQVAGRWSARGDQIMASMADSH